MDPNATQVSAEKVIEHYAQELAKMTQRAIIAETALNEFMSRFGESESSQES